MIRSVLIVSVLLFWTTPLIAQRDASRTRAASSDGTVKVTNLAGRVVLVGWPVDSVSVSGTLGSGIERLEFSTNDRETRIRVVEDEESSVVEGADLEIRVPARSYVAVRTAGAPIEVSGITGALDLESVGGPIDVRGRPRTVYARSAAGDVSLDVESKVVRASSVDGDVTLAGARGYLEVSTVSGTARVTGARVWEGEVTTVSGDIVFSGSFDPEGSFYFESHSGMIELRLPREIAADFVVSTFSGSVENQLVPGADRSFSAGGGGTQVRVKTFKGTIRFVQATGD